MSTINTDAYEITFTPDALEYIEKYHKAEIGDKEMVVLLAELHGLGTAITIELHPRPRIANAGHFLELFPEGYNGYPFAVYVDYQTIGEGYLPEHMLIDLSLTTKGMQYLEFKNPDFET